MATHPNASKAIASQNSIIRFSLFQRIEHILLIASFSLLALTGLIQKFAGNPVAEWLIGALGGIETVRTIHHVAAIVFALEGVYHFIVLAHKVYVKRVEMTMLPGLRDVTDAIDVIRVNLGLSKDHPRLPRYNFAEKAEYWAMLWGFLLMGLTGLTLWNPITFTEFLPGQFIPAAKAAHGAEAILAVLAILVWHIYNVHLKMFNKSMFTGKMTRHQMEEEHAEELARLAAGDERPAPSPEAIRRRERTFVPVAVVGALFAVALLYLFTSYETTAIATVPPAETGPAFAPLTPTPVLEPGGGNQAIGAPIPHPVEGQEQCETCHGPDGVRPQPADHAGRPVESCLVCHQPGAAPAAGAATPSETGGGAAPAILHTIDGREQCSLCHGAAGSLMPLPASHEGRDDPTCQMCHKPEGAEATPEARATSESGTSGGAATPKAIPHSITEAAYQDCLTCHGAGKLKPFPENHASFSVDSCTTCHQPAASGATPEAQATAEPEATTAAETSGGLVLPKAIPHSITEAAYQDCLTCHGAGKLKPFPASHANFTVDSCTTCHKPAQ